MAQASTSNQTKSSFPMPVVFLLVTALIVVAGGYFTYTYVGAKKTSVTQAVTDAVNNKLGNIALKKLTESDFTNISDMLIRKHFAAQFSVPASRITSTSNGMDAKSSTVMEMETSGSSYSVHMMQIADGKTALETITIGEKMYVRDLADGKWWVQSETPKVTKMPSTVVKDVEKFNPEAKKEVLLNDTTTQYIKLGEEKCGDLQCYKYQEKSSDSDSPTRTFWFDTKEYLLRKEQNGYGEFTSESTYAYDNVKVEVPTNTKEVPKGKDITEMMVAGMMGAQGAGNEYEALKKMAPSKEELESLQNSWSDTENSDEFAE